MGDLFKPTGDNCISLFSLTGVILFVFDKLFWPFRDSRRLVLEPIGRLIEAHSDPWELWESMDPILEPVQGDSIK